MRIGCLGVIVKFYTVFLSDIFQTMLHRRKGGDRLLNIRNGYAQLIGHAGCNHGIGQIIVADDMKVFFFKQRKLMQIYRTVFTIQINILTCQGKINHFTWNMLRILHDGCIIHIAQEPIILCTVLINAHFAFIIGIHTRHIVQMIRCEVAYHADTWRKVFNAQQLKVTQLQSDILFLSFISKRKLTQRPADVAGYDCLMVIFQHFIQHGGDGCFSIRPRHSTILEFCRIPVADFHLCQNLHLVLHKVADKGNRVFDPRIFHNEGIVLAL